MATTVNKYLDNSNFLLATAVYDDAALTIPAADGFYQQNGIYREQLGGTLIAGSTTCPSCAGNSQALRLNGTSAIELCCATSSAYTGHFATGDSFTDNATTQMYADAGLLTSAPDGFYKLDQRTPVPQYREMSSGALGVLTNCPTCPTGGFYISLMRPNCKEFCATSPSYVCAEQRTTTNGADFISVVSGDTITGTALPNGFYAYAPVSGTATPNGFFRIMNVANNVIQTLSECASVPGNCQNL